MRNLVGRRENRGNPWKSGLAGAIEFEAKGNWASGVKASSIKCFFQNFLDSA